jgi:hypothetical protein
MKTHFIFLVFFTAFNYTVIAQDNTNKHKLFNLLSIQLNDGTKLKGFLTLDSKDQIQLTDFNLGNLILSKDKINDLDSLRITGDVLLETINKFTYFGRIISINEKTLTLNNSSLNNFEIELNQIDKITPADAYVNRKGKAWFTNPNATRYFFAPSAIPLNKREGYFQNIYLLANSVNVGITNNITIGGGVVIPLLFYVTPKISYKVAKNFYAGAGVLYTQSFIKDFDLSASIGYGLITIGNTEHNFTIGSGYGMARFDKKYKETPMPIFTLNGMTRISKKISLVTENWLIPRAGYNKEVQSATPDPYSGGVMFESIYVNQNFYTMAASAGLRIMPGLRTSVDFSVVSIKASPIQDYMFLPYLDFVYKF